MTLEDLRKSPTLRKALSVGEEQVGKVVGRLLASERIHAGLRGMLDTALWAREAVGRGLEQALHAAKLPSREDVAALRERIADLEAALDGLAARVGAPKPDHPVDDPGGDPGAPGDEPGP